MSFGSRSVTLAVKAENESPRAPHDKPVSLWGRLRPEVGTQAVRNTGLMLVLGALLLSLAITHQTFFSGTNIQVVLTNMVMLGIACSGMTLLMISGNVDLSVGSVFALIAVSTALLSLDINGYLAFFLGIPIGAAIGLINGLFVWRIKISPLIITLAGMGIYLGVAELINAGNYVPTLPSSYAYFGQGYWLGINIPIWMLVIVAVATHVVLSRTTLGRHIYAVGGNREAAEITGIRVRRLVIGLFVTNGILIGLAAVLEASRFDSASTQFGTNLALQAVTAVILGGVAFTGGEGSLFGVAIAVTLITVVQAALIQYNINAFYSDVTSGALLLVAVTLDQLTHDHRERHKTVRGLRELRAREQER
jgi:ribose/xylose/arabinose/galactoside ABC-type transport system permease subunit